MEMTFWKAIFLGIVQGVTEFLPVSSSGHLVLFQTLFGIEEGALIFDTFLHFGTLLAIVFVYWEDVKKMVLLKKSHRHLTMMVLIGIIPAGLMGVLFQDLFETFFSTLSLVGVMWLITGALIWASEKYSRTGGFSIEQIKVSDALTIGLAQGFAIIPGISRAGSTIIMGLFRGLTRKDAARYSFLISLPTILGATILKGRSLILGGPIESMQITFIFVGVVSAMLSGYLAIRFLLKMLQERSLIPFAYYCWILGVLSLLSQLI